MSTDNTIWFCATGKSGLGHLRRCATVAGAVRRLAPDRPVGLATNAPATGLRTVDREIFSQVEILERPAMAARLAESGTGPVVTDTAVVPGLSDLRRPLALILRESPKERLNQFRLGSGRPWDLILVPNPGEHWLPEIDAGFARDVVPVGWIYREPPRPCRPARERPRLLVATGGGGTPETAAALKVEIDALIRLARETCDRPFTVAQALGPLATPGDRLDEADETVKPDEMLHHEFALADVVVSTAGYNSVLELALTDTPTLLVAIPRSIDDQPARARLWGPRLGAWHDPADRQASADWLARCIGEGRSRDRWDLGPSGCAAAARRILALAE